LIREIKTYANTTQKLEIFLNNHSIKTDTSSYGCKRVLFKNIDLPKQSKNPPEVLKLLQKINPE